MPIRYSLGLFLILLLTACEAVGTRTGTVSFEDTTDANEVAALIDSSRIRGTIEKLASFGTRMTGYPGATEAANYLAEEFKTIGLENVALEEFVASAPLDEGGDLQVLEGTSASAPIPIYSVWPNLIRTSTLPPEGLTGKMYYVGEGEWKDFNGIEVADAIIMMDFNTGLNWENAANLGARAVVFAEPEKTNRVEGEEKYLQVPLNFPRFWMKKADADPLKSVLEEQPGLNVRARARMTWKRLPAYNVLGKITGTHPVLKDEVIVLESYYDSMSPVPAVSPGANQASSVVAMLEMARYFREHPPARTVYFLATSGHFLSLSGVSDFTQRHTRKTEYFAERIGEPINMKLFVGLDLSSARDQVGIYYAGIIFAGNSFEKQRFFTPFGRKFMNFADQITGPLGASSELLMNVISPPGGIRPTEFFPAGGLGLDGELIFWTGYPALSFATVFDAREFVDTPLDTPDRVNVGNLYTQTTLLTGILAMGMNDPDLFPDFKMQLEDLFVTGRIKVVEFDPTQSFIPDVPKPGAVVRFRRYNKSISGVKNEIFVVADSNGVAESTELEAGRTYPTEGYVIDPETGDITYAPDRGPYGEGQYPLEITMDWVEKEKPTVVFRSEATNIYDLVDPRFLTRLNEANLLDASGNPPLEYGLTFQEGGWTSGNTYEEDTAVLFNRPGSRFKVTMSTGLFGRRLVLTNASEEFPEGIGFEAGTRAITQTSYRVALDMWHLDESRIQALKRAGINSDRLESFHDQAKVFLDKAEVARQSLQWDVFIKHARAAWGYESRAYPDATDTANDVMKGVLFYMALIIPFAYALERLLFGYASINKRLAMVFGIFLVSYFVLRLNHPAFQISSNPDIVLLAFITLTLAGIVIMVLSGRFSQTMQQYRQVDSRLKTTDVQRSSALATAFALGVGNMRKRKARTLLTCLTLVLLVFTVLSFTSVQTYLRIQKVAKDTEALYSGFLVRNPNWGALQKQTHQYVQSEFASSEAEDQGILIVPRSWYVGASPGVKTFVKVERSRDTAVETDDARSIYASALLGVTAAETEITRPEETLTVGRWLMDGEENVCLLPTDIAELLAITPDDVGRSDVMIFGQTFRVIGLFDPIAFDRINDLDGEPITPVDFTATGTELMTELARKDYEDEPMDFVDFDHILAAQMVIVPQEYVNDIGGPLRSVAVKFPPQAPAQERLDRFMARLGIPVVASIDGKVAVYSAMALSSLSGLGNLFIPMLVAAMIILNTMMNAVYERFREIGVYSAVGLAPAHIGALFMAEACMFAVIGGMAGYLIGQTGAQLITQYDLLPGLTLNYSSLSAVASTALVMAIVLLSTVYPARKASEMAVPDVNRQWSFPLPEGDLWEFEFPFTVGSSEVLGLYTYLTRIFDSHEESSLGTFMTQDVRLQSETDGNASLYQISMMSWLAPYDMGISQAVTLSASPSEGEKDIYSVWVVIRRESGDSESWQRLNRRFLNTMRKHFLVWRTIDQSVKESYAAEGQAMLTGEVPQSA